MHNTEISILFLPYLPQAVVLECIHTVSFNIAATLENTKNYGVNKRR